MLLDRPDPDKGELCAMKGKGIPGKALAAHGVQDYVDVLHSGEERFVTFASMESNGHIINVERKTKKGLSCYNDKVYQLDHHHARPLGHWRNEAGMVELHAWLGARKSLLDMVMAYKPMSF